MYAGELTIMVLYKYNKHEKRQRKNKGENSSSSLITEIVSLWGLHGNHLPCNTANTCPHCLPVGRVVDMALCWHSYIIIFIIIFYVSSHSHVFINGLRSSALYVMRHMNFFSFFFSLFFLFCLQLKIASYIQCIPRGSGRLAYIHVKLCVRKTC